MKTAITVILLLWLAACGKPKPATPNVPKAVLFVKSDSASASVWVDGRHVGTIAEVASGIRMTIGRHEIEVTEDGKLPVMQVVELTEAGATISTQLFPQLP